jgi:G:T/U-mismatch repair DNA glycosylase
LSVELFKMPSTSPANAGMKQQQKLEIWRKLYGFI